MNYIDKKHKWWHFIFGTITQTEIVYQDEQIRTNNYWEECKKCGEQVGEKQGITTLSFEVI